MDASPKDYYFRLVCEAVGVAPDQSKTYSIPCPQCGKGGKHFAFNYRFARCFKCGYQPFLRELLKDLGGEVQVAAEQPVVKPRKWQLQAQGLLENFTKTPGNIQAWQSYKPLPEQVIVQYQLGSGVFPDLWHHEDIGTPDYIDRDGHPHWRCRHKRLIIPLLVNGAVVGWRCRSINCSCPRWLSPGGSRLLLYNGGRIGSPNLDTLIGDSSSPEPPVRFLFIVENPIDALLIEHFWGHWAVATLGVAIWRKEWTQAVKDSSLPSLVAYDNDPSGNATDPVLIQAWIKQHPGIAPPLMGPVVVRRLRRAGCKSGLFTWPNGLERGTDIGDLFMDKKTRKQSATERLARWFVTEMIGREWDPSDFRSMHMKHAKQLMTHYSIREICGCLQAIKDGLFGDFEVTYMTLIEKLEPPLIQQYRAYLETPPPVYLETETAQWQERKERTYSEIEFGLSE